MRIGRGVYCRTVMTRFGLLGISEREVIPFLTCANRGVLIGYRLYNRKHITTQISKYAEVISTVVPRGIHRILNINVRRCNVKLTEGIIKASELLDIVGHKGSIEDFNRAAYHTYVKSVIKDIDVPDWEVACDVLSIKWRRRDELVKKINGLRS